MDAFVVSAFISVSEVSTKLLTSALAVVIELGTDVPNSAFLVIYQSVFANS